MPLLKPAKSGKLKKAGTSTQKPYLDYILPRKNNWPASEGTQALPTAANRVQKYEPSHSSVARRPPPSIQAGRGDAATPKAVFSEEAAEILAGLQDVREPQPSIDTRTHIASRNGLQ